MRRAWLFFIAVLFALLLPAPVAADWYMAGANEQRTSFVPEEVNPLQSGFGVKWYKVFEPFILSKSQLIAVQDKILVTTADGLYALDANNGDTLWSYLTELPPGHSPTVKNNIVYVPGMDKSIHAISLDTGQFLRKFSGAEAGFDTNPLVLTTTNTLYAGNRDGYFYCLNLADLSLLNKINIGAPVTYSAAHDTNTNRVYFGALNGYAYAVDATTCQQVWQSVEQLPGEGFYTYWPVVYKSQVFYAGSSNFMGSNYSIHAANKRAFQEYTSCPTSPTTGLTPDCNVYLLPDGLPSSARGIWITLNPYQTYLSANPYHRTFFSFNTTTGLEEKYAPVLWQGNNSGNRYPAAVNTQTNQVFVYNQIFYSATESGNRGWAVEWDPSPANKQLRPFTTHTDVADEQGVFSLAGKYLYYTHHSNRGGFWYTTQAPYTEGTLWVGDEVTDVDAPLKIQNQAPGYADTRFYRRYGNPGYTDNTNGKDRFGTHGNQSPLIPYSGKLYVHLSNAVIAFGSGPAYSQKSTQKNQTATTPDFPTLSSQTLTTKLKQQLSLILDPYESSGKFLSPVYFNNVENYVLPAKDELFDWGTDYWHNPADTVFTLLTALNYLKQVNPTDVFIGRLRTYLTAYQAKFPLATTTHTGWKDTTLLFRDYTPVLPELANIYKGIAPIPTGTAFWPTRNGGNQTKGIWWNFNPFNFYSAWLYAKENLGTASSLLSALCAKAQIPPVDSVLQRYPHVHNIYIAGYIGLTNLQAMAPGICSFPAQTYLDSLKQKKAQFLNESVTNTAHTMHPYNMFGSEAGGFLYLVPELADYLSFNASQAVASHIDTHDWQAPYWFVSRMDEPTRFADYTITNFQFMEGTTSHWYEYSSPFLAKALILKQSQEELIKYLDAPAVARGDLFYIQNLTYALKANGGVPTFSPTPTIGVSIAPTISQLIGDIDGDGDVDIFDYTLLLENFGRTDVCEQPYTLDDDCDVDVFDYTLLLENFGQ